MSTPAVSVSLPASVSIVGTGAQGPPGPQGATGATGPAGPAGANGYTVPLKSGWYYPSDGGNPNHGMLYQTLWLAPFDLEQAHTLKSLNIQVKTAGVAGATIRLGVYSSDGAGGVGNLLVDAGTVAGDSTGIKSAAISTASAADRIWLGAVWQGVNGSAPALQGSQRVVRSVGWSSFVDNFASGIYGYSWGGITGALPASLPVPTSYENGQVPNIQFTVA